MKYIIIFLLFTASLCGQTFVINDSTSGEIDIGENYLVEIILPDLISTSMSILTYDSLHSTFVPFYPEGLVYSIPLQSFTHSVNFKPAVTYSLQGKIKLKFNDAETIEKVGSYKLRLK